MNPAKAKSKTGFTKKKGVEYNEKGLVVRCVFCRIHTGEEPGRIAYHDESMVVFHTKRPATHLHLLVTPREHITNINSLHGVEGATLVEAGKKALGPDFADSARYCFHIPPRNSIDHLHLHAIAAPNTMSNHQRMNYPAKDGKCCRHAQGLIDELKQQESPTN
jgi:diadenosine tetraphosphate (Ap4A) HIT family hydrolase